MKITYVCEICDQQFDERADAEACEARGRAAVPQWLLDRLGREVLVFGESGIQRTTLKDVITYHDANVTCCIDPPITVGNQQHPSRTLPLYALDPHRGRDFMWCMSPGDTEFKKTVRQWATYSRECGIEPNPEEIFHWRDRDFINAVRRVLEVP